MKKMTEKELCQSLFFNNVDKSAAFKKRLQHVYFHQFCKVVDNTYSGEHLRLAASENWEVFILI